MTRGLSTAQINASAGPHRVVAPLIEMFFDSGTLRLVSFQWDVIHGANTYIHAPLLIERIGESATSTQGMRIQLNGLDPAVMAIATAEPYHGRVCRLLKGYMQPDSNMLIGDPRVWFPGRMRNMVIDETNDTANVSLIVEHYDEELDRASPIRLNDSDQQRFFPGDRGCEFAADNAEKSVIWPSKEAQRYGLSAGTSARLRDAIIRGRGGGGG